jgi:hypothetical protein
MKLSRIVLKLRLAETRFEDNIAGAADLGQAMSGTLQREMAFVIPLAETTPANQYQNNINQIVNESFGVVVALPNDSSQADKTGITAHDLLEDIRADIFKAILGWQPSNTEGIIYYGGGRLIDINPAWFWWMFTFAVDIRLDDDDGIDTGLETLDDFETIYAQYILAPDDELPVPRIPVDSSITDMEQEIDLT